MEDTSSVMPGSDDADIEPGSLAHAFTIISQVAEATSTTAAATDASASSIAVLSNATVSLAEAVEGLASNQANLFAAIEGLAAQQAYLAAALDGNENLKTEVNRLGEEVKELANRGQTLQRITELAKTAGAIAGGLGSLGGLLG